LRKTGFTTSRATVHKRLCRNHTGRKRAVDHIPDVGLKTQNKKKQKEKKKQNCEKLKGEERRGNGHEEISDHRIEAGGAVVVRGAKGRQHSFFREITN